MREILFRGKREVYHQWVEGYLVYNFWHRNEYTIHFPDDDGGCCDVIPETVGQYTGLTDKNGKKIFEGDLFRVEDDIIAVVIFEDGGFRLKSYGICGTFTENGFDEDGGGYGIIDCEPIDWYYIHDMEVIGNIHDNPELLRKDDEK